MKARRIGGLLTAAALAAGLLSVAPVSSVGAAPQAADNYRLGDNPNPLRGKTAPGLAVDPADSNHVVETDFDLNDAVCETSNSTDGGKTWSTQQLPTPPGWTLADPTRPCEVLGHGANEMDAGVAFGSGGNVYVAWASAKTGERQSVLLSKSTDGGATFGPATVAVPGGAATTSGSSDKQFPQLSVVPGSPDKVIISTFSSDATIGDHSTTGKALVAVSNDGGATFGPAVQANADSTATTCNTTSATPGCTTGAPNSALTSPDRVAAQEPTKPVVLGNAIYVAYRTAWTSNKTSSDPTFQNGLLRLAKSTDGGATWTNSDIIQVAGFVYFGPGGAPYGGSPSSNVTVRFGGSSFARLQGDPNSGNLYLVWAQDPHLYDPKNPARPPQFEAQEHFEIQNSQVWFTRLANAPGATPGPAAWTDLRLVSEASVDGRDTQTRHPNISVAPNGRVDIIWETRQHSYRACTHTHLACDEARLGDIYLSSSNDGGVNFTKGHRVDDRSHNNDVGFDYRFSTYWDFGPVSVPLGNDKILAAWMDSREGNNDTDTQDIYLAQVNVTNTGTIPAKAVGTKSPIDLSVALSQLTYPGGNEATLAGTFASRPVTKVIIVNQKDPAGALIGGVLARANLGPVLLSGPNGLTQNVKDEISRLSPVGAYVIGTTTQLSNTVVSDIANASGLPSTAITRISGTKFAEAKAVALALDRRSATDKSAGVPAFNAAVIAVAGTADASAAAGLASARRLPVLFVSKTGVPTDTSSALTALNINKTLVAGGTEVIADSVLAKLPNPTRMGVIGNDAIATSKAVVEQSISRGVPANQVFVADASKPMHGALLGSTVGRYGGLLLLSSAGSTSGATNTLTALGIKGQIDRFITSGLNTAS